jgi:hypothetical protein
VSFRHKTLLLLCQLSPIKRHRMIRELRIGRGVNETGGGIIISTPLLRIFSMYLQFLFVYRFSIFCALFSDAPTMYLASSSGELARVCKETVVNCHNVTKFFTVKPLIHSVGIFGVGTGIRTKYLPSTSLVLSIVLT